MAKFGKYCERGRSRGGAGGAGGAAAHAARRPSQRDLTCFIKRFVGVIASNLSEESRASDFVSILCFLF